MNIHDLEKHLTKLLKEPLPDPALRTALEALASVETVFGGLTWLWGPALYERDRLLFRSLIMGKFASFYIDEKRRWQSVPWKGEAAKALEAWLAKVDAADDVPLFRRLNEWKLSASGGLFRKYPQDAIRADLVRRIKATSSAAQRRVEMEKLDIWFVLDEASALEVYRGEPGAGKPFILKHLPVSAWTGDAKREIWSKLCEEAKAGGDAAFARELYRRQVPPKQWKADVLALCDSTSDPARLCEDLERIHPRGLGNHLNEVFQALLEKRGRAVQSYLMAHVREMWSFWRQQDKLSIMAETAAKQGLWELWAVIVRCGTAKVFSQEVAKLVKDSISTEQSCRERLLLLAGVSRELNFPGLGMAQVLGLEDDAALALYRRFPDLMRSVYRLHLQFGSWNAHPKLVEEFHAAGEHDLVDFLASRALTWQLGHARLKDAQQVAERLVAIYNPLRTSDPAAFTARAANALGMVPAYGIWWDSRLVDTNPLARLLLERSARTWLDDERALADLIEAPNIHVQTIAYRALGLDDPRAPALAARHLTLLLGTLLRPLHRATRLEALRALANAAAHDRSAAERVLARAKEAMVLPDMRYPKEALVGLMGRILHAWPDLASAREKPVVFGLEPLTMGKEAAA